MKMAKDKFLKVLGRALRHIGENEEKAWGLLWAARNRPKVFQDNIFEVEFKRIRLWKRAWVIPWSAFSTRWDGIGWNPRSIIDIRYKVSTLTDMANGEGCKGKPLRPSFLLRARMLFPLEKPLKSAGKTVNAVGKVQTQPKFIKTQLTFIKTQPTFI